MMALVTKMDIKTIVRGNFFCYFCRITDSSNGVDEADFTMVSMNGQHGHVF